MDPTGPSTDAAEPRHADRVGQRVGELGVIDVANGIDATLAVVDTVHIELEDDGTFDVPTSEFEATERGLAVGLRFVPWHRVRRYGWALPASVDVADPNRRIAPVPAFGWSSTTAHPAARSTSCPPSDSKRGPG